MTLFEELCFWLSSLIRNYRTNERVNELINYLLENRERVEIENYDGCYIVLKIDGNLYSFWIYGHYFAYLSHCYNSKEARLPSFGTQIYKDMMPSRVICKRFYETFEKPALETIREMKRAENTKSLILPPKCEG